MKYVGGSPFAVCRLDCTPGLRKYVLGNHRADQPPIPFQGRHSFYSRAFRAFRRSSDTSEGNLRLLRGAGRTPRANARVVRQIEATDTPDAFFSDCAGITRIYTTTRLDLVPDGAMTFHGTGVVALAWLDTRAFDAWSWSTCEVIDASFYALRPYVYFVFQGIYHGIALPLGLMMCPSETTSAIDFWHALLQEKAHQHLAWSRKPVVADGHLATKVYCEEHARPLFMCLFHLPRTIGCPFVQRWVSRACYTYTRVRWCAMRDGLVADIAAAVDAQLCSPASAKKAFTIIGWDSDNHSWGDFPQAMFRRPRGVESTSNKAERMHGVLNGRCIRGAVFTRVVAVVQRIEEVLTEAHEDQLRNPNARLVLVSGKAGRLASCDCGESEWWSESLGVADFPCAHREPFPLVPVEPLARLQHTLQPGLDEYPVLPGDDLLRCWELRHLRLAVPPAAEPSAEQAEADEDVDEPAGTVLRDLAVDLLRLYSRRPGNARFLSGTRQATESLLLMHWGATHGLARPDEVGLLATAAWKVGVAKRAEEGRLDELFGG